MQNARENLFKKLPDDLVPLVEYDRQINLRFKITNGIPLRPHDDILAAIKKQDIGEFWRLYSGKTRRPTRFTCQSKIIINTVKDANTVMMFAACGFTYTSKTVHLEDFATEKLSVAKLGFQIMPYVICEMSPEEQLAAVQELPKNVLCHLNTQPQSPLAHLRPVIMSRFAKL